MADALIGIGVLLAILGPLLLLPITWVIYRLVTRPLLRRNAPQLPLRTMDQSAFLCATVLVLIVLVGSYLPGKIEYNSLCDEYGQPRIMKRVTADGFYRSRVYIYEAREFIEKGGFKYVEGPYPGQRERFRRYSISSQGQINEVEIAAPTSAYGVRDELWETGSGVIVSVKTVYEKASESELARAANITYRGGPLWFLMGSYATTSCPDILTEQGSEDFTTYYNLEKIVLNDQAESSN